MSSAPASTAEQQRLAGHLQALAELPCPLAYVDVDAFDANAQTLLAQAGGQRIRVASKSVRCDTLIDRALATSDRFQGVMAFTIDEALHCAARGIGDVLLGYPSVEPQELARLAEWSAAHPRSVIRAMVDDPEHLRRLSRAAQAAGAELRVCLDLDASWRPAGGRGPAIGPKRSPVRTPEAAVTMVREAGRLPGVRIDALMAYDGQIAGVGDAPPGRPLRARAIRLMQQRSLAELAGRVPRIVEAVERALAGDGGLAIVNVGGTGSLNRIRDFTAATELTAGSGLYAPTLFDTYRHLQLQPAAFFVLPVVRRPGPRVATLLGGGYLASGPATADRLPTPVFPVGLRFDGDEGAGEVQTPVLGEAAAALAIGDRVILRHTKAGELCERFAELALLAGGQLVGSALTYRGAGHTFL